MLHASEGCLVPRRTHKVKHLHTYYRQQVDERTPKAAVNAPERTTEPEKASSLVAQPRCEKKKKKGPAEGMLVGYGITSQVARMGHLGHDAGHVDSRRGKGVGLADA